MHTSYSELDRIFHGSKGLYIVNGPGHMTKMAGTTMYCKNFKQVLAFSNQRTNGPVNAHLTIFQV